MELVCNELRAQGVKAMTQGMGGRQVPSDWGAPAVYVPSHGIALSDKGFPE